MKRLPAILKVPIFRNAIVLRRTTRNWIENSELSYGTNYTIVHACRSIEGETNNVEANNATNMRVNRVIKTARWIVKWRRPWEIAFPNRCLENINPRIPNRTLILSTLDKSYQRRSFNSPTSVLFHLGLNAISLYQ